MRRNLTDADYQFIAYALRVAAEVYDKYAVFCRERLADHPDLEYPNARIRGTGAPACRGVPSGPFWTAKRPTQARVVGSILSALRLQNTRHWTYPGIGRRALWPMPLSVYHLRTIRASVRSAS